MADEYEVGELKYAIVLEGNDALLSELERTEKQIALVDKTTEKHSKNVGDFLTKSRLGLLAMGTILAGFVSATAAGVGKTSGIFSTINAAWQSFIAGVTKGAMPAIRKFIKFMVDKVIPKAAEWGEKLGEVIVKVVEFGGKVKDAFVKVWEKMEPFRKGLETVWGIVKDGVSFAFDMVIKGGKEIWDWIIGGSSDFFSTVGKGLKFSLDFVIGAGSKIWDWIKGIWETATKTFDFKINWPSPPNWLVSWLKKTGDWIEDTVNPGGDDKSSGGDSPSYGGGSSGGNPPQDAPEQGTEPSPDYSGGGSGGGGTGPTAPVYDREWMERRGSLYFADQWGWGAGKYLLGTNVNSNTLDWFKSGIFTVNDEGFIVNKDKYSAGGTTWNAGTKWAKYNQESAEWTGYKEGGVFSTPTPGIIGEMGPEVVVPLQQYNELLAGQGGKVGKGGSITVNNYYNGDRIMNVNVADGRDFMDTLKDPYYNLEGRGSSGWS